MCTKGSDNSSRSSSSSRTKKKIIAHPTENQIVYLYVSIYSIPESICILADRKCRAAHPPDRFQCKNYSVRRPPVHHLRRHRRRCRFVVSSLCVCVSAIISTQSTQLMASNECFCRRSHFTPRYRICLTSAMDIPNSRRANKWP